MAHTARYAFTARTQQRWPERPCGCQVFAHGTSARWPPSHQPPVPRPAYLQERSAQGITASISSEVLTRSCQEHPDAPCQRHRPSRPDLRTQRQPTALQTSSLPPSHAECGLGTSAAADAPTALGRRQWGMSVFGAALGAATNWGAASPAAAVARPAAPLPLPACAAPLDADLATAWVNSVVLAASQQRVMEEEELLREAFRLRDREFKYADEAARLGQPLPSSGGRGLANPAYFNVTVYALWKVLYARVTDPAAREALARAAAANLLASLPPTATAPGPATPSPSTPAAAIVLRAVSPFLDALQRGGYLCAWQLVLGEQPGSWPADWMLSEPQVVDSDLGQTPLEVNPQPSTSTASSFSTSARSTPNSPQEAAGADGFAAEGSYTYPYPFQLKLHRPADIGASVALRSEEGAAWPHTVSLCLEQLLRREAARQGQGRLQEGGAGGTSSGLGAGYGIGAEESGSGAQGAQEDGTVVVEVDEYFYQDVWQGPRGLGSQLLLLLGDPLEQVGVDFVPTSLVQDWRLQR